GKVLLGGGYELNDGTFSSLSFSGSRDIFHAILESILTSIAETKQQNKTLFKAYPNPVKDILQIEVVDTREYTLKIYNNKGSNVFTQHTKGNITINIQDWSAGIYHIQYTNSKKEIYQQKIIIHH